MLINIVRLSEHEHKYQASVPYHTSIAPSVTSVHTRAIRGYGNLSCTIRRSTEYLSCLPPQSYKNNTIFCLLHIANILNCLLLKLAQHCIIKKQLQHVLNKPSKTIWIKLNATIAIMYSFALTSLGNNRLVQRSSLISI